MNTAPVRLFAVYEICLKKMRKNDKRKNIVDAVKAGLLGLGTVGGGTVNVLKRNMEEIARRAGRGIVITHAAARDLSAGPWPRAGGGVCLTGPAKIRNRPDAQSDQAA